MLRQVRQMAASARKDLVDAVGVDDDGEMAQTVRELRDLDPRRAMNGVLTDEPTPGVRGPGARPSGPAGAERAPGAVGPKPTGAVGPATTEPAPGEVGQKPTDPVPGGAAAPVAPPVVAPAPVDPDWT
jgi:hypothetical protein